MNLNMLVDRVNGYLAGENLTYNELLIHLDAVLDDINHILDSNFPTFSEFTAANYPTKFPNYDFFPDNYIRSVVCLGAAFMFFLTDEEGAQVAVKYEEKYRTNLFLMQRDYSNKVPVDYQAEDQGYLNTPEKTYDADEPNADNLHPLYYLSGEPF